MCIGSAVDVLFIDVSKVFDTVPHSNLLQTISYFFGVVGKLQARLLSFLTGRTQSVKTNFKIHSNLPNLLFSVTSSVI